MTRMVYVGGLNTPPADERLLTALKEHFNVEDIDAFTFAGSVRQPDKIGRAAAKVAMVTNSAGFLAARTSHPAELTAFSAPLPTPPLQLLTRTQAKTTGMFRRGRQLHGGEGVGRAIRYSLGSLAEVACHPLANLGSIPRIAATDAFEDATAMVERGTPVTLAYMDNDEYYFPELWKRQYATKHGVRIVHDLPGEHDELVLRPDTLLTDFKHATSRAIG